MDSILKQSYHNFLFLIVDDASTDNSVEIIKSYSDHRIKLVQRDNNGGIVQALNTGLATVKGDYLIRMDADDIACHDRIEKQVKFMDSHPEVGVCGSWVNYFGARKGLIKVPVNHNEIVWALMQGSAIYHPAAIIRMQILNYNNLIYESIYPHAEDYLMWIKLSRVTRLANIPEALLNYRVTASSVSGKNRAIQQESCNQIRKLFHEILIDRKLDEEWYSISPDIKAPLQIHKFISLYNEINNRNNLFQDVKKFNSLLLKRIKQLILLKGADFQTKIWILNNLFTDIRLLKYLVY